MTSHTKSVSLEPKRLRSGNYTDHCDDCGVQIVASTADQVLAASCRCHERRTTQHVVELVCLMCGRELGAVQVRVSPHACSFQLASAAIAVAVSQSSTTSTPSLSIPISRPCA